MKSASCPVGARRGARRGWRQPLPQEGSDAERSRSLDPAAPRAAAGWERLLRRGHCVPFKDPQRKRDGRMEPVRWNRFAGCEEGQLSGPVGSRLSLQSLAGSHARGTTAISRTHPV